MFSPLRNRFGIPGVISVIALVFAMFGGAYAASNSANAGKATASAKKGPPGPRGPRGKTGATGPAGPQGPAGANGKDGAAGANGKDGADGAAGVPGKDGESVKISSPTPAECASGGSKFTVGTQKGKACNGVQGPPGPTCDEATGKCLLPPGATETGIWGFGLAPQTLALTTYAISYPLRLQAAPEEEHFVTEVEAANHTAPPQCPGSSGEPKAAPGNLCVYAAGMSNVEFVFFLGEFRALDPTSGSELGFSSKGEKVAGVEQAESADGAWAVTAPAAP